MQFLPRLSSRVRVLLAFAVMAFSASALSARVGSGAGGASTVHWKPMAQAQLKLDDKTPLAWNVYEPERKDKKKDPSQVLVLLGRRYLLIDIKARLVYSVLPSNLVAQGTDFESGDLAQPSRLITTTDWSVRDVGPMQLVELRLGDYGRVLQVQLPHMPDLRPFY
jgi:hypothetical protein